MIRRELGIFLVVGVLTVIIDYFVYRTLVWSQLLLVHAAKGIGFVSGTVFAYFANRFWTFGHKQHATGSLWRFVLLYATTLLTNVWVNALMLSVLSAVPRVMQLGFLIATVMSAMINFIGMKFFVFKAVTSHRI